MRMKVYGPRRPFLARRLATSRCNRSNCDNSGPSTGSAGFSLAYKPRWAAAAGRVLLCGEANWGVFCGRVLVRRQRAARVGHCRHDDRLRRRRFGVHGFRRRRQRNSGAVVEQFSQHAEFGRPGRPDRPRCARARRPSLAAIRRRWSGTIPIPTATACDPFPIPRRAVAGRRAIAGGRIPIRSRWATSSAWASFNSCRWPSIQAPS